MPKIIPNLKERILEAAQAILMDEGYQALSMRALAQRCGVAPGTLYNYVADKDELVATITLADWQTVISQMQETAAQADSLTGGLTALCALLDGFTGRYRSVWEQSGASEQAHGYIARYHRALRGQLAEPIRTVCARVGRNDLLGLSDVLAETLLACSVNADLGCTHFSNLASALDASSPLGRGGQNKERA